LSALKELLIVPPTWLPSKPPTSGLLDVPGLGLVTVIVPLVYELETVPPDIKPIKPPIVGEELLEYVRDSFVTPIFEMDPADMSPMSPKYVIPLGVELVSPLIA